MDSERSNEHRFGILRRLASAAPDAALAGLYLWCWIDPLAWRKTLVAELMLIMVVEFLVVHSGPFLGMVVMGEDSKQSRATRLKILLGLGAVYLLFAGGMSAALLRNAVSNTMSHCTNDMPFVRMSSCKAGSETS